jgi:hypothetical protein
MFLNTKTFNSCSIFYTISFLINRCEYLSNYILLIFEFILDRYKQDKIHQIDS